MLGLWTAYQTSREQLLLPPSAVAWTAVADGAARSPVPARMTTAAPMAEAVRVRAAAVRSVLVRKVVELGMTALLRQ
jgi:hypothetical protein